MISFAAFADEFVKIARITPEQKADRHHEADVKDWAGFESSLKTTAFQKAILNHPDSDSKLKKYVKNFGGYIKSKDVVAVMPSRTSSKIYKIKELPSGRLACGCKDWQYYHSVRNSDCDHIMDAKAGGMIKKARAHLWLDPVGEWKKGVEANKLVDALNAKKEKKAVVSGIVQGAIAAHRARNLHGNIKEEWGKGVDAKKLQQTLHPKPKRTWEDRVEDLSAIGSALA